MPRASKAALTPADARAVAALAGCDPRTLSRYLRGEPQPSTTIDRIEGALRHKGRGDLVRPRGDTAAQGGGCPECEYERKHGKAGAYEAHTCDAEAVAS